MRYSPPGRDCTPRPQAPPSACEALADLGGDHAIVADVISGIAR